MIGLRTLLQRVRQAVREGMFRRSWVRHRYGGHELEILLADPVGKGWYDSDWPEPPELAVLRRGRLREGATIFDLGAHQGIVALMMARAVGPSGKVIAVEAGAFNARIAEANRARNHADNLTVLHAIVTDAATPVKFNPATGRVERGVLFAASAPAVSIDSLAERYGEPDVVYLDIEGFEGHALRGASRTLAGKADFFVEVHAEQLPRYGESVAGIMKHFPEDSWELHVQTSESAPFRPVADIGIPLSRFFLVALRR